MLILVGFVLILIADLFDENCTHKNPLFPPQLSKSMKNHTKNPRVIPYNCQNLMICVFLGNLCSLNICWNLMPIKTPHNLPNCRNVLIWVHFIAIITTPLAPTNVDLCCFGVVWWVDKLMILLMIWGAMWVGVRWWRSCFIILFLMFWIENDVMRWVVGGWVEMKSKY